MFYQYCRKCSKKLINRHNLLLLRSVSVAKITTGFVLGLAALPMLGFTASGVMAGSLAAAWQSSIGNVTAGSMFAILQSLGTAVYSKIMFGSVVGGLIALRQYAVQMNFCTCDLK